MKTLKLGSKDAQVKDLCSYLGLASRETFDEEVKKAVITFQAGQGLTQDGIVGFNTWKALHLTKAEKISAEDYKFAAFLLDCEVKALKAVVQVETGGLGGFLSNGLPPILFEGHVFWKELQARGINPESVKKGNEDILYKTWTKSHYKGGVAEWPRLEKARKIDLDAANASASWGIFQIMGNNYKAAGCVSVSDFVKQNMKGEVHQMFLGVTFIKNNANILKALQKKDWTNFAKYYNGSGQVSTYSTRLKQAYNKL